MGFAMMSHSRVITNNRICLQASTSLRSGEREMKCERLFARLIHRTVISDAPL